MSTVRTPIRLVPMPRRMPRRGRLFSVKNSSSAVASAVTLRTSPATTTPGSSGTRASCTSFAGPPLLTTREAAIWEAPILRPTISCLRRCLWFPLLVFATPGARVFFFGRRTRPDRLISLFIFTSLHLRREPQAALVGGLVAGKAAVHSRCRGGEIRHAGTLEDPAELVRPGRAREAHLRRDDAA